MTSTPLQTSPTGKGSPALPLDYVREAWALLICEHEPYLDGPDHVQDAIDALRRALDEHD